jgi:TPP-dependent indolepyruvate ferredoxin oxidoreductase alpha subunit
MKTKNNKEIAKLITGNEACAEAAIIAGMRFFGGYPITPSSEIAEVLARRLPQVGGVFIQMEDELASMATIIGASLTGIKSMTATKISVMHQWLKSPVLSSMSSGAARARVYRHCLPRLM